MVGPCVQNNVYNLTKHELWKHGSVAVNDVVRTFDGFKEWLLNNNCEGLVFHHPDGRMCKIRRKDMCNEKRKYKKYDNPFIGNTLN